MSAPKPSNAAGQIWNTQYYRGLFICDSQVRSTISIRDQPYKFKFGRFLCISNDNICEIEFLMWRFRNFKAFNFVCQVKIFRNYQI